MSTSEGREATVAEWIAENAYRYDLTSTRSDSGEEGWVDYEVANEAGIAQMYEDMIAAGVGLTTPARQTTPTLADEVRAGLHDRPHP